MSLGFLPIQISMNVAAIRVKTMGSVNNELMSQVTFVFVRLVIMEQTVKLVSIVKCEREVMGLEGGEGTGGERKGDGM